MLNGSEESSTVIWTPAMRKELLAFLSAALEHLAPLAPRQELRVARHVGHQVEQLSRLERNDSPFLVTGSQEAVSL